jgi:PAS domain-containing protein
MSHIIGDKKENIIGKNILDFVDKKIDSKYFTTNSHDNNIKSSSFEASFLNKEDKKTKCLVNITKLPKNPILSEDEESLSKFAMVTDVSELKNKELILSEYKHIVSASKDIIAIISPEFMVTPMNEPAKNFFSSSENKDLKIHDFFKKDTFEGKLKQRILMASKGELSHTRIWLSPLTMTDGDFTI